MSDYVIELAFLAYDKRLPEFCIYRCERKPSSERPSIDVNAFSLPIEEDNEIRKEYWVSLEPHCGFEPYTFKPEFNHHLMVRALSYALSNSAASSLEEDDYDVPKSFYKEVSFNFKKHVEGTEQLVCEPYYLREIERFGWLFDFRFKLKPKCNFSRKVQQLSLSLDRNFKRNPNAYIDRRQKIIEFYKRRWDVFTNCNLNMQNSELSLASDFAKLPSQILHSKLYFFGNNKASRSQSLGLKEFGPLQPIQSTPKLVFVFEERFRLSARKLASALKGTKYQVSSMFPGFSKLFQSEPKIDPDPVVIPNSSAEAFQDALQKVKSKEEQGFTIIPILVLPDTNDNGYLEHKSIFANAGIPSQVCTLKIIDDRNSLKWSIANIALQIFCKCGGKPWKVKPTTEKSLIIGISQSHRHKGDNKDLSVEKYFAFSVMTDNSGLFQEIKVLSEGSKKDDYIAKLKDTLRTVLEQSVDQYNRVILHTSFKLKREEINAIKETVNSVVKKDSNESCKFAVIKINHNNRFFGFNPGANNMVPFEGSYVSLGKGEYLIWFEGIFRDQPTANRAFPGPTHVQVVPIDAKQYISHDELLQDLLNLSGANWRGFNAKSSPVSIFYCHLIAKMVRDFQLRELPMPAVQDLKPWFL